MKKVTSLILVAALMGVVAPQNLSAQEKVAQIEEPVIVEEISNKPIKDGDDIYFSAEQIPIYPGGEAALMQYIASAIQYPAMAINANVQGRVIIQFIVEKDGSVTKVRVLRGVDAALDKEAVRVVSMSPKWKPGKQRDRAVPVTYTFPVIFQLR